MQQPNVSCVKIVLRTHVTNIDTIVTTGELTPTLCFGCISRLFSRGENISSHNMSGKYRLVSYLTAIFSDIYRDIFRYFPIFSDIFRYFFFVQVLTLIWLFELSRKILDMSNVLRIF
mgnify:CR=1 FL=1